MLRDKIEKSDFRYVEFGKRARRKQLAHRLIEMHPTLFTQLSQQQPCKSLSYRSDFENGVRFRIAV